MWGNWANVGGGGAAGRRYNPGGLGGGWAIQGSSTLTCYWTGRAFWSVQAIISQVNLFMLNSISLVNSFQSSKYISLLCIKRYTYVVCRLKISHKRDFHCEFILGLLAQMPRCLDDTSTHKMATWHFDPSAVHPWTTTRLRLFVVAGGRPGPLTGLRIYTALCGFIVMPRLKKKWIGGHNVGGHNVKAPMPTV
jgi:hypothetical protein